MKFLFAIAAFLALAASAFGVDVRAIEWCRQKHGMDPDINSYSVNDGCVLYCFIHGRLEIHKIYDYFPCPLNPYGVCVRDQCVRRPRAKNALALASRPQLGRIDVKMISASLAAAANAYMVVCVRNTTASITLPITNYKRDCVASWRSKTVSLTLDPSWNEVCPEFKKYLFSKESRVFFEIFGDWGIGPREFMGGASITIPDVLKKKPNNKAFSLPLSGGKNRGSMRVCVTYTPKK